MTWKGKAAIVAAFIGLIAVVAIQYRSIKSLSGERDKYRRNTEGLLAEVETFRVRDSLNGARVASLELSLGQYKQFRERDAAMIKTLQGKNRDLSAVNKSQSQTILELRAVPRDTVVVRDSVRVQAVAVHCGDAWYDFDGLLSDGAFTGQLRNRDSLLLVESVRYKRFLWWKTHRVKDRRLDCVSLNPHTKIIGLEHVVIEK